MKISLNSLKKIANLPNLKNIPVLGKLIICFSFIFIFMIILSYTNFAFYTNDKEESILEVISKSNIQLSGKIDSYINDLNNITKSPILGQNTDDDFLRELELFSSTQTPSLELQKSSNELFDNIFNYKEQIQSIFLFNLDGKSENKIKSGILTEDYNPINEHWFNKSIISYGKPVIIDSYEFPQITQFEDKDLFVFSMARGIVRLKSAKVVGVLLVNTSLDFIADLCTETIVADGQRIVISNREGKIVYDTQESNITRDLEFDLWYLTSKSDNETLKTSINDSTFYISHIQSETTGWKIINLVPQKELLNQINIMKRDTIIITVLIVLASFIIVLVISRQIIMPLHKLVFLMKLFEKGDFDVQVKVDRKDEIGVLSNTFNKMANRVNNLVNRVYLDKIDQKELEIQLLQNQINPHFLYNTLSSIQLMAQINKDKETSNMAFVLGKIMRYGMSRDKVKVTVSEEISHINDYIDLQKTRFKDIFKIVVDVDKSIFDCIIIKMILQPVIENSIYHGFLDTTCGGIILIKGYKKRNNIIFEVSDNGKGIPSNKVKLLNDYINDLNNEFDSIGLKNVHKRLKLYYGENYGLTIYSEYKKGTKVIIKIPDELSSE